MRPWVWAIFTLLAWCTMLFLVFFTAPSLRHLMTPAMGPAEAPVVDLSGEWINDIPPEEANLILYEFWDYGCMSCVKNVFYTEEIWRRYKDDGLAVVSVHTPQYSFEESTENVRDEVTRLNISYPVLVDTDKSVWTEFENWYRPATYLVKNGMVVWVEYGESDHEKRERKVRENLGINGTDPPLPTLFKSIDARETKSLYAGTLTMKKAFGNIVQPELNDTQDYVTQAGLPSEDEIYLHGKWLAQEEYVESMSDGKITLSYKAGAAYPLLEAVSGDKIVNVQLNGKVPKRNTFGSDLRFDEGKASLVVDEARYYYPLSHSTDWGRKVIVLEVPVGVRFYAFEFGSH